MAVKKRKKRWAIGDIRFALVLIPLLIAVFLTYKFVKAYSGSPETTAAVRVTAYDSIMGTGWFFRDEITVSENKEGALKHMVYSGERVQQDAVLAAVYSTSEALELSRRLDPLEKKIALLDSVAQSAGDGSDAAKLDQQITLSLQQMADQIKQGSGSALSSYANSLRTLSIKREAGNLNADELAAERNELAAELKNLNLQMSGKTTRITSPVSGYFSEVVDGYENVMRPELLEDLTLDQLHNLTENREEVHALGKVIQGFNWYLAAEIPAEDVPRLKVGQDLSVSFTQASLESPATVISVSKERDDDTALVVLEGSVFGSEMVSMREQPVEIILGTYTGLKVPKAAVRVNTASDGKETTVVFIQSGSLVKTKNITDRVLFEADDYYVVRQGATDIDGLVVKDQIIIRGKNLQNNMVVKT